MAGERKPFGPLLRGTLILGAVVVAVAGFLQLFALRDAPAQLRTTNVKAAVASLLPGLEAGGDARLRSIQGLADLAKSHGPSNDYTPALDGLRRSLADPDWSIRSLAAQALGFFGPVARPAADDLIRAMREDGDDDTRIAAAAALIRISGEARSEAVRVLGEIVGDPEISVHRGAAVAALVSEGEDGQETAAKALAGLISSRDSSVRAEALGWAPMLGPSVGRMVPLVQPSLESEDAEERTLAAMICLTADDANSPPDPRLTKILEEAAGDASQPMARRQEAINSLYGLLYSGGPAGGGGSIGLPMGFMPGSAGPQPWTAHRSSLRRCGLALARQLSDDDPEVRFAAAVLLQMIDPETLSGKDEDATNPAPR
ncbi:MAG: HEAT repeat domain-containing protein [Isosphaeraceae bacterium]